MGTTTRAAISKRTSRACDACRRRKAKCDGEPTCGSCESYELRCSYGSSIRRMRGPAYVALLENKVEHLEGRLLASCDCKGSIIEENHEETTSHSPFSDKYESNNELDRNVKENPMAAIASGSSAVGKDTASSNGWHGRMPTSNTVLDAGLGDGTHDSCISQELTNAFGIGMLCDDVSDNISCSPVHPDESVSLAGTTQTAQHSLTTTLPSLDECFDKMISDAWAWPGDNMLKDPVAAPSFYSSTCYCSVSLPSQRDFDQGLIPSLPKHEYAPTLNMTKGSDPSFLWNDYVDLGEDPATAAATPAAAAEDKYPAASHTITSEANRTMALGALPHMPLHIESQMPIGGLTTADVETTFLPLLANPCPGGSPVSTVDRAATTDENITSGSIQPSEQHDSFLRERNRVAAAKYRTKKVAAQTQLAEDVESLGDRNACLRRDLLDLKRKRTQLRSLLRSRAYKL